jgi:hypothetical protein
MATTSNTITATAGQTEFSFSFPYLKKESIKVTIDTVATTAFTIPDNNPTTVILNSGATAGQVIVISRLTSTEANPATFFSGGAIRSQDLNDNFDSILYITQERENQTEEIIQGGIADGSITSSKLADQSVGTAALIDGGVATVDLADNAVTTPKIINDAVTTPKIINDAVTTDKIINDAVTTPKIVNDAVTTPKIVNDAVTTPKILDANVTPAKLSTGGPGWTSSGALGLNGANYGTQYQIAQSNGSGSASTWVNRSVKDTAVDLVSSPLDTFKNIAFDTAALAWASKIDIYFRDVSCNDDSGSLAIKLLDQTNNYFSAGTLIGFGFALQYYNAPTFVDIVPRVWAQDNGINMPWGVDTSTRTGRLTLFNAQSTVWMVDFQTVTSTNPVFPQQFQGFFAGNGYQVQPASGTGQLGGVQFLFNVGNIDSGAVSIHYS